MRLPEGVTLRIEASSCGVTRDTVFQPSFAEQYFDRVERVDGPDGIVLHYAYRAPDAIRPEPPSASLGMGAVIYAGEVYATVDGSRWALESPTYGFPFASRQCTVLIELPASYPVMPEAYRQFLRFCHGDQRQVLFGDFGDMVAANIPAWMRRIIAAMMPASEDYLNEIKADLQHLLQELGLKDEPIPANVAVQTSSAASASGSPPAEAASVSPRPKLPTAPEILPLDNDQSIMEKGLVGRAGRFYSGTRQIFVNTRYSPFLRLAAQLEAEFGTAAERGTVATLARQVAEWSAIRRLGRAVVYGMAKKAIGWSDEERARVQSPESLSLTVDDVEAMLPPARARMASLLGQTIPAAGTTGYDAQAGDAQRLAGELADGEAKLQQAMLSGWPVGISYDAWRTLRCGAATRTPRVAGFSRPSRTTRRTPGRTSTCPVYCRPHVISKARCERVDWRWS
ncbi:hypothetical protein ACFQU2_06575 [Siccirubricoccus deserti]